MGLWLVAGAAAAEPAQIEAGLTLASAYAFRGLNVFGADQRSFAPLVGPALAVIDGPVRAGWFGSFQGTSDGRAALVRAGVGHEQNGYVEIGFALTDHVELRTSFVATAYPWADARAAGTALPVWVEPRVAVVASSGDRTVGVALSEAQCLCTALADGDYTYGQVWAERAAPIGARAATVLRATGGGKAWSVGRQGRDNTWDAEVAAGLRVDGDRASFAPTAHLTWTNLSSAGPRAEAFAWAGVELAARR